MNAKPTKKDAKKAAKKAIDRLYVEARGRSWLHQLSSDQRAELLEIRRRHQEGAAFNLTRTRLVLMEEWGLNVSLKTFGDWMRQKPPEAKA